LFHDCDFGIKRFCFRGFQCDISMIFRQKFYGLVAVKCSFDDKSFPTGLSANRTIHTEVTGHSSQIYSQINTQHIQFVEFKESKFAKSENKST
jgi:hypothetical protein